MAEKTRDNWDAWNAERQRLFEYDTQGFDADTKVLETHIANLKQAAPKDTAGWPTRLALRVIDHLEEDLQAAKAWQGLMTQEP